MKWRNWQIKANNTIKDAIKNNTKIVAVNACVGSGKTFVAFEAIKSYIDANPNLRTLNIFVTPRIRLANQQKEEFDSNYGNILDVKTLAWDCKDDPYDKVESELYDKSANNIVIFVVDKSLWGDMTMAGKNNKTICISRFNRFSSFIKNAKAAGWTPGIIAYDEAHNYERSQKKMFGKEYTLEI